MLRERYAMKGSKHCCWVLYRKVRKRDGTKQGKGSPALGDPAPARPALDGPQLELASDHNLEHTVVNVAYARPEHRLRLFRDTPDIDWNRIENSLRSSTQQPSPMLPQFTVHHVHGPPPQLRRSDPS